MAGSNNPLTCVQICVSLLPVPTHAPLDGATICINAFSPPSPGCSYTGSGLVAPATTCGQVCAPPPSPPFAPCDPTVGTSVERCLCKNGAPTNRCSYTTTGLSSSLTCPQVCAAALTTTTSTSSPGMDADAIILTCIAQRPPAPGCSYTGQGGSGSLLTCATICQMAPFPIAISAPCDPSAGSHIEQCLCIVGSPSNGCSYLASGSSSPLTCPQVCANPTVTSTATTTTTVSSANTNIGHRKLYCGGSSSKRGLFFRWRKFSKSVTVLFSDLSDQSGR